MPAGRQRSAPTQLRLLLPLLCAAALLVGLAVPTVAAAAGSPTGGMYRRALLQASPQSEGSASDGRPLVDVNVGGGGTGGTSQPVATASTTYQGDRVVTVVRAPFLPNLNIRAGGTTVTSANGQLVVTAPGKAGAGSRSPSVSSSGASGGGGSTPAPTGHGVSVHVPGIVDVGVGGHDGVAVNVGGGHRRLQASGAQSDGVATGDGSVVAGGQQAAGQAGQLFSMHNVDEVDIMPRHTRTLRQMLWLGGWCWWARCGTTAAGKAAAAAGVAPGVGVAVNAPFVGVRVGVGRRRVLATGDNNKPAATSQPVATAATTYQGDRVVTVVRAPFLPNLNIRAGGTTVTSANGQLVVSAPGSRGGSSGG